MRSETEALNMHYENGWGSVIQHWKHSTFLFFLVRTEVEKKHAAISQVLKKYIRTFTRPIKDMMRNNIPKLKQRSTLWLQEGLKLSVSQELGANALHNWRILLISGVSMIWEAAGSYCEQIWKNLFSFFLNPFQSHPMVLTLYIL